MTWNDALLTLAGIIFIDLVLSSDNALVIGAAASTMTGKLRVYALLVGGAIAVTLRIVFTTFATFLLSIPYLQTIGGLLVLLVAIRQLREQNNEPDTAPETSLTPGLNEEMPPYQRAHSIFKDKTPTGKKQFITAIFAIVIADVTMSVDNIISVAALAKGNILFLVLGLGLSVALLILGSAAVAALMNRFPILTFIANLILAAVSANLIWNDLSRISQINHISYEIGLYVLTLSIVIGMALFHRIKQHRQPLASNALQEPDAQQQKGEVEDVI